MREGDRVDVGSPLFALAADLQRAAVAKNEAAVALLLLTHFIRIVRGIMLKSATAYDLQMEVLALAGLMLVAMTLAVRRFRRTLD